MADFWRDEGHATLTAEQRAFIGKYAIVLYLANQVRGLVMAWPGLSKYVPVLWGLLFPA